MLLKIIHGEGENPLEIARDFGWLRAPDWVSGHSRKHGWMEATTMEVYPEKAMTSDEYIQEGLNERLEKYIPTPSGKEGESC